MEYRYLGNTGIKVSFLSLGTLPLGPLQAHLKREEGAGIITHALSYGVNLLDTAELYGTYSYIKCALRDEEGEILVASKSYAITEEEMERSVKQAIAETGRSSIDLFMLHQQESGLTLKGHRGALDYLVSAKKKGIIRAAGLSTHHIAAVQAALTCNEIDFVFVPLNYKGLGIQDGTLEEMLAACREAHLCGKGILVMKPLGGGHLGRDAVHALAFLRGLPFISSINIGVQSIDEFVMDYNLVHQLPVPAELEARIGEKKRALHIESCQGCGRCVQACPVHALQLSENGAKVNGERCVLCGYCAAACPEFCIKLL
jgi:aryl-alcohol dehydrogenase-like predicted oxidoreductase